MAKYGAYEKMTDVYNLLVDFDADDVLLDFISQQIEQIKKKNHCHTKTKKTETIKEI